jgi:hypothetical protein
MMAMNRDYVPANDTELCNWLRNFVNAVAPFTADLGVTADDVTPLSDTLTEFDGAVTDHVAKQAAAKGAVEAKKLKRAELENVLRPFVRRINNHPGMMDGIRGTLGLHVPNGGRTRSVAGSDVPGILAETRSDQVIIHFGTDPGNEQLNGKPAWAKGCNIYRRKADESDFSLIAFDTASPYVDTVHGPPTRVTYKAAYRATRDNDLGPSSEETTVTAGG